MGEAVAHCGSFGFEGAEHAVPDDEHTTVVPVEVSSLEPWCTRWWLGVFNTNSIGAQSLSMASVWIPNWYTRLIA